MNTICHSCGKLKNVKDFRLIRVDDVPMRSSVCKECEKLSDYEIMNASYKSKLLREITYRFTKLCEKGMSQADVDKLIYELKRIYSDVQQGKK